MNDHFEKMLKDSEDKADALNDKGHLTLILDLEKLLQMAKEGHFHDFHRNGADAPKLELVTVLGSIKDNLIKGLYDN